MIKVAVQKDRLLEALDANVVGRNTSGCGGHILVSTFKSFVFATKMTLKFSQFTKMFCHQDDNNDCENNGTTPYPLFQIQFLCSGN